jgi:nucleoporin NDC1
VLIIRQAIAFWELALITDSFEDRRKTIYGELERNKLPTYKQVVDICLVEIKEINRRISTALDPKYRPEDATGEKAPAVPISLVPQISQPLHNARITGIGDAPETRLQKVGAVTSQIARAHSSPQNAQNATARVYLKQGQEKLLKGAEQAESVITVYSNKFASSPFGSPFRSCIRRTANVVVNGAPYSRQSSIFNAITTLANLTVFSLKEDEFGQFNNEVPEMVRVFTAAIRKIEGYVAGLQIHWTDVDCLARPEAERKKIPEVDAVTEALKEGLERILGAFNEFLMPMGMTRAEVQEAKKAVARWAPWDMEEIRR